MENKEGFNQEGFNMEQSKWEGVLPRYASGYKVTFTPGDATENNNLPAEEIVDNGPHAIEGIADRVPADFVTDDNG